MNPGEGGYQRRASFPRIFCSIVCNGVSTLVFIYRECVFPIFFHENFFSNNGYGRKCMVG